MYLTDKKTFVFQLSIVHKVSRAGKERFELPKSITSYLTYRRISWTYDEFTGRIDIICRPIDLAFYVEVINGCSDD